MKILMVGAHQDDAEFQGGGIAALYRQHGDTVRFLSVCNGNGGHHLMTPEETRIRRRAESREVEKLLDIEYDVWDDVDDCSIVADLPTRRRLIRYIRSFSPDLIITHRPNDYHADHRNASLLVQDASYLLIVPHECPDVPAMKKMPVILYFEDKFKVPPFVPDMVVDVDSVAEIKIQIADCNVSQVYEWLPYTEGEEVPPASDHAARLAWLRGMEITADTTDAEVMAAKRGYSVRFAKTAARFRSELTERYGAEHGGRVRFAEAFSACEYGAPLTDEAKMRLFPF